MKLVIKYMLMFLFLGILWINAKESHVVYDIKECKIAISNEFKLNSENNVTMEYSFISKEDHPNDFYLGASTAINVITSYTTDSKIKLLNTSLGDNITTRKVSYKNIPIIRHQSSFKVGDEIFQGDEIIKVVLKKSLIIIDNYDYNKVLQMIDYCLKHPR